MHNIRFIRHDRHAEPNPVRRAVNAAEVRKALGAELLDRLIENALPDRSYAVEIHGYVWEAVRN